MSDTTLDWTEARYTKRQKLLTVGLMGIFGVVGVITGFLRDALNQLGQFGGLGIAIGIGLMLGLFVLISAKVF